MNADFKVLLDACVLANYPVCDLYLRLAEKPRLLLPKWTREILDETRRTHVEKLGWPDELGDSFQDALQSAFPEAMIEGYSDLIPLMTNNVKDRHVLAAAVREKLDIIITFNLKDFKDEDLKKWGIKALHPQDYLLVLYSINPAVVFAVCANIAQKKNEDLESVIISFGTPLPLFSQKLLEDMGK